MFDLAVAVLVLVLLCGSAYTGRWLLKVLPETHRTQETKDFTRIVSGLLVTFTALVLSLLITSVNGDFKKTDNDLRAYASMIVLLDGELDAFGRLSPIFVTVLVFWLVIVFLSFGMTAPPNMVAAASIAMVAVSVAGAIFVILERDGPLDGFLQVGSEPMRHALHHLDRVPDAPAKVGIRS